MNSLLRDETLRRVLLFVMSVSLPGLVAAQATTPEQAIAKCRELQEALDLGPVPEDAVVELEEADGLGGRAYWTVTWNGGNAGVVRESGEVFSWSEGQREVEVGLRKSGTYQRAFADDTAARRKAAEYVGRLGQNVGDWPHVEIRTSAEGVHGEPTGPTRGTTTVDFYEVHGGIPGVPHGNRITITMDEKDGTLLRLGRSTGWMHGPTGPRVPVANAVQAARRAFEAQRERYSPGNELLDLLVWPGDREAEAVMAEHMVWALGNEMFGSTRGETYRRMRQPRLCYHLFHGPWFIWVDAVTGEVIGGSIVKGVPAPKASLSAAGVWPWAVGGLAAAALFFGARRRPRRATP